MSAFSYTLVAPLSLGTQVIASRLSTVLAGLGGIQIIDLRAAIFQSERNGNQLTITICYQAMPNGLTYAAAAIIGMGRYDVDGQFALWYPNNPAAVIVKVIDATPPDTSDFEAVVVVYSSSAAVIDPGQTLQIVRNTSGGSIAALASGVMTVLTSAGLSSRTIAVVNNSGVAWGINVDGYASVESISGSWVGTIL